MCHSLHIWQIRDSVIPSKLKVDHEKVICSFNVQAYASLKYSKTRLTEACSKMSKTKKKLLVGILVGHKKVFYTYIFTHL